MSKILVGILGKARSGKDTIADYLMEKDKFTKASFAIPVKQFAIKHFDLEPEEVYGDKTEKSRWILQSLGNGCREEFGKNIWIDKLFHTFGAVEKVVISDVRYKNEAEAIQGRGGIIIKVVRPDAPEIECGADHPSETEQDVIMPNFTICNDGSLAQLYQRIDGILSLIKAPIKWEDGL